VHMRVPVGGGHEECRPVQAGPFHFIDGGAVGLCVPGRARHRPGIAAGPLGSALGGRFGALELTVAALGAGREELAFLQGKHVAALAALVVGVNRRLLEARKAFRVHRGSPPSLLSQKTASLSVPVPIPVPVPNGTTKTQRNRA